jgi:hypothetical protein
VQDTFIFSCRVLRGAAWLHPHASKHGRPVVGRQPNDTNNGAVLLGNQDDAVGATLAAALPALVKPANSRQVFERDAVHGHGPDRSLRTILI